MEFIALDVETANADMASICQLGLAFYKNNSCVDEHCLYLNPQDAFSPINVSVHGITPDKVIGAPLFLEIAPDLQKWLTDKIVVCHTHFDRVALQQCYRKHDLDIPRCKWLDSALVARRTWKRFARSGYGLHSLCNFLNYDFAHHNALEDAKAAAFVMIAAMKETGLQVDDWLERVRRPIGFSCCESGVVVEGNVEGPYFGDTIVFTGALSVPRREATDVASRLGFQVAESVTRKTNVLVVGDQDAAKLCGHDKSSKHRKAEELAAKGQNIRIISESDFLEIARVVEAWDAN